MNYDAPPLTKPERVELCEVLDDLGYAYGLFDDEGYRFSDEVDPESVKAEIDSDSLLSKLNS